MQIIKSFRDDVYYKKYILHYNVNTPSNGEWLWGIDAFGKLYCKCNSLSIRGWLSYPDQVNGLMVDLKDMMRIVKEFGHLLVFL